MAIHQATAAAAAASPAEPKLEFGRHLEQAQSKSPSPSSSPSPSPSPSPSTRTHRASPGVSHAASGVERTRPAEAPAARAVDQVARAQHQLDRVLALAQSGRTFSPAELLGLQAQVYSASQELDLAGKVVEKATSGVKQVLQTQI